MMEAFLSDPAVGWDYGRMVHGDQAFTIGGNVADTA